MGTRSLTVLREGDGTEIAVLYRLMDGYPDGHGQELAEYLAGAAIVNGISSDTPAKAFNGAACLAASVVAHFKDGIGGFYLYPAGTRGQGEDYIYTIVVTEQRDEPVEGKPHTIKRIPGTIVLRVEGGYRDMKVIFEGTPEEFLVALMDGTLNEGEDEEED